MKASILAIGTELTTGQIVNQNAANLSTKLKALGVIVTTHLTVPDDRQIILKSLKFLETSSDTEENSNHDIIFVTGGLGPTSDDFTRDLIAEWSGLPMKFDETSWIHIQERLKSRGFVVHERQKQQCYFPEKSEILFNSEGTANGFKLFVNKKTIYVLPGPPREIESIWKNHILADLTEKTKNQTKLITKSWDTLGLGESDVATLIEDALKGRPSGLEVGYRVHLPYVEIKLSYLSTGEKTWSVWMQKVDEVLKAITITRDFADVSSLCCEKIKNVDFTFYDFISEGFLFSRLALPLKNIKNWSFKQSTETPSVDFFEGEDNFLALLPFEDYKCVVIYSIEGQRVQKTIEAPMKAPVMTERRRQFFTEMALFEFSRA
ncbi:MAG: molybdopterin-binding protein [Bdellovibrionota bacterium]